MPSTTFLNLNEDKKERILDLAMEEFSSKPYGLASVTLIINQAEIAKGSLYQYFGNKKGLYLYLISICLENRTAFMDNEMGFKQKSLFKWYSDFLIAKANFDLQFPIQSALLANAIAEEWSSEVSYLKQEFQTNALKFFKTEIKRYAKKKTPKEEIELLAYTMMNLARGFTDNLILRLKKSNEKLIEQQQPVKLLDHSKFIKKSCQQLAKSLKSGFAFAQ